MMAKCFGGASPQAIGQAFKRIDADGDKELTWEEFVDTAEELEKSAATAARPGNAALRALFDSMDQDANGRVSSKEWGKALSKNSEAMAKCFGGASPQAIGQVFKRIDADGDKELTWEEFVDTAQKFESPSNAVSADKAAQLHAAAVTVLGVRNHLDVTLSSQMRTPNV